MGLVLWIDQNTFATSLLEKVFKKKNQPFYTLDNAKDIVYLVEDLNPRLLVLDLKTTWEYREDLKNQYQSSQSLQKLPAIYIGEGEGPEFVVNAIGKLSRPFDPFGIPEKLEAIFKASKL